MNISMPNGDKIAIWDTISAETKDSWATVLRPGGSYDVVDVEPLAQGAFRQWTSPVTHQRRPYLAPVQLATTPSIHTRRSHYLRRQPKDR